MTGCVQAVCLANRLVNESTGGRHPSHFESDPASLRLYCRLVLFQVRMNRATKGPESENIKKMFIIQTISLMNPICNYITQRKSLHVCQSQWNNVLRFQLSREKNNVVICSSKKEPGQCNSITALCWTNIDVADNYSFILSHNATA